MNHWKHRIMSLITWSTLLCVVTTTGCAWFQTKPLPHLDPSQQLVVAVLPVALDLPITKLSSIRSMNGQGPQDESQELAAAIEELRAETRWLFLSRLATRWQFRFVPSEEVNAAAAAVGLIPGAPPTDAQLAALRTQLEADVLVAINILDYGKMRWQWLAVGMLTDTTVETIAFGLATAWNPAALLGNVGFNLLTSTPIWFGGGYLFGLAGRPVRVEASALETVHGEQLWSNTEVAIYLWKELRELPLEVRAKKEVQLKVNLMKTMETLADDFAAEGLNRTKLGEQQRDFERDRVDSYARLWGF